MWESPILPRRILGHKTQKVYSVYEIQKELGSGFSGCVRLCKERTTGELVACKSILKASLIGQEDVDDLLREIEILEKLKGHPNIVELKGVYEDKEAVHLVMEYCQGGDLFSAVSEGGPFKEPEAAEIVRQLAAAVRACHAAGVLHRDLKPENVLLVHKLLGPNTAVAVEDSDLVGTPGSRRIHLKLADFGLSKFVNSRGQVSGFAGSPYYVAPELLSPAPYGLGADIWSLGVVVYIVLSNEFPFAGANDKKLFQAIRRGRLSFDRKPWPSASLAVKRLISSMITVDPRARLTIDEVLDHSWTAGMSSSGLHRFPVASSRTSVAPSSPASPESDGSSSSSSSGSSTPNSPTSPLPGRASVKRPAGQPLLVLDVGAGGAPPGGRIFRRDLVRSPGQKRLVGEEAALTAPSAVDKMHPRLATPRPARPTGLPLATPAPASAFHEPNKVTHGNDSSTAASDVFHDIPLLSVKQRASEGGETAAAAEAGARENMAAGCGRKPEGRTGGGNQWHAHEQVHAPRPPRVCCPPLASGGATEAGMGTWEPTAVHDPHHHLYRVEALTEWCASLLFRTCIHRYKAAKDAPASQEEQQQQQQQQPGGGLQEVEVLEIKAKLQRMQRQLSGRTRRPRGGRVAPAGEGDDAFTR
eukprot:jgi/Mesen1/617/ME000108S10771